MSLLLLLASPSTTPIRIGQVVHLSDKARPATRRCCPAMVTRVMAQGERQHPPLQLEEHVAYSGNTKAMHPTGGWLHMADAGAAFTSWHYAEECPDGK